MNRRRIGRIEGSRHEPRDVVQAEVPAGHRPHRPQGRWGGHWQVSGRAVPVPIIARERELTAAAAGTDRGEGTWDDLISGFLSSR